MARSSQPQQDVAAGSVFRVFGSLVMGPSWIWIFMKINIFLFEDLKRQDFLDPYFSDTCMWVQDPSKWGYQWFFGFFGSIFMGPSWIWIVMKINIFLFEDLKSQDFLDPYFSDTCMWVQDPSKWGYPWFFGGFGSIFMGPSWIWIFMKINIFLFGDLKSQDFLDPDFFDRYMWVQDPSKWGYP